MLLNGARKAVELEVSDPRYKPSLAYWFDPDRGYALLGRQETADGITPYLECTVDEMVEAALGVFYPTRARMVQVDKGVPFLREEFIARSVTANQPVPAGTFVMTFAGRLCCQSRGRDVATGDAGVAMKGQ